MQIQSVVEVIGFDAVNIGMLHAPEIVEVVAWAIDQYRLTRLALDPVMVATSGERVIAADTLTPAAKELLAVGAQAVLLKGGHLIADEVVDLLLQADGSAQRLAAMRIASRNVHGTGSTLSSAIAAHLALGHPLQEAVTLARGFILSAIAQGSKVTTGQGHGPLNHGFAPMPLHRITNPPSTVNT